MGGAQGHNLVTKHDDKSLLVFSLYREKEETTQSTTLERNRRKENKPGKTLTENKELSTKKTSDNGEKDEGNYEELVCLVRQFYVERPVNPAAIAHQNIETC